MIKAAILTVSFLLPVGYLLHDNLLKGSSQLLTNSNKTDNTECVMLSGDSGIRIVCVPKKVYIEER